MNSTKQINITYLWSCVLRLREPHSLRFYFYADMEYSSESDARTFLQGITYLQIRCLHPRVKHLRGMICIRCQLSKLFSCTGRIPLVKWLHLLSQWLWKCIKIQCNMKRNKKDSVYFNECLIKPQQMIFILKK